MRHGPRHNRTGQPSAGFMRAYVRRYIGQRAKFALISETWKPLLVEMSFDTGRPIVVNGIFVGVWRKPKKWPVRSGGPLEFHFRFNDVLFQQDEKIGMLLAKTRYQNKRREWEFTIEEMGGTRFAQMLRDSIPKLEQGGMQREIPGSAGGDRDAEYE